MESILRPYQVSLVNEINQTWSDNRRVLGVLPTGAGKTKIVANVVKHTEKTCCVIAHRSEIVKQLCEAMPGCCVIGPGSAPPSGRVAVVSVDSIHRCKNWLSSVGLWVIDEAHHAISSNKWGRAVAMMPNAIGLGVTATPQRLDGRALDLFDVMVEGPDTAELIKSGYLQRPQLFAPPSGFDRTRLKASMLNDYEPDASGRELQRSKITGNVVEHYLKLAPGCLGMTFAATVEHGQQLTDSYNRWGVPAVLVTAKTSGQERARIIEAFRNRRILQLVNVDLYGEGTDVPGLEVVSLVRPTKSLTVHRQQCGRVMRVGGRACIIIDHVGNLLELGKPDMPVRWSLEGKAANSLAINPLRACPECTAVYERVNRVCPYCNYYPEPADRTTPAAVDGDLIELEQGTIKALLDQVAYIDRVDNFGYLPALAAAGARKRHRQRREAQGQLRRSIARWCMVQSAAGLDTHAIYRRFYHCFRVDILTAKAYGRREALALDSLLQG